MSRVAFGVLLILTLEGDFIVRLTKEVLDSSGNTEPIEQRSPRQVSNLIEDYENLKTGLYSTILDNGILRARTDLRDELKTQFYVSKNCTDRSDIEPLRGVKVALDLTLMEEHSMPVIEKENPDIATGGQFNVCDQKLNDVHRRPNRVAILIPFRDRWKHLRILLQHMHPVLQRQAIDYQIFIIEQTGRDTFNKGRIFNSGFTLINALDRFDCIIFHDVDLLLENDNLIYNCEVPTKSSVKHLATFVDTFNYVPQSYIRPDLLASNWTLTNLWKYRKVVLYGGVTAMTPEQFQYINGYSNTYWGWGCEDEDIGWRLLRSNFNIYEINNGIRPNSTNETLGYRMIRHSRDRGNYDNWMRFYNLKDAVYRQYQDGLSDLKFNLISIKQHQLFTQITVDIGSSTLGAFAQRHILKDTVIPPLEQVNLSPEYEETIVQTEINVDELRRFLFHVVWIVLLTTALAFTLMLTERRKNYLFKPVTSRSIKSHRKNQLSLPQNIKLNSSYHV